jgi:ADP-heptose:LPS heptosyltransferase
MLRAAKRIATHCMDGLVRLIPVPRQSGAKTRLLLIKLDALGDFVLWLPMARALRNAFPKSSHHITLLGNELWKDLALRTFLFDEFWEIERERFRDDLRYRYRNLLRIRRAAFDTVIQMQLSREFFLGDSIIRTCGAKTRVGPRGDAAIATERQLRIADCWYTKIVDTLPTSATEVERNAHFFRGVTGHALEDPLPRLKAEDFASPLLERLPQPFFVLVPGASIKGRMWPAENYAELARRIMSRFGWSAVICGDAAHSGLSAPICTDLGSEVTDLTGKTSLIELFSVLSRAKLYVGNETGPAHVAAAFSVPALVLLGGGHFGRFFPYPDAKFRRGHISVAHVAMDCFRCDWKCRYVNLATHTAPCVDSITVDSAWQEALSILPAPSSSLRNVHHT